jgi:tetratricopeptide (TPR) repeat protein
MRVFLFVLIVLVSNVSWALDVKKDFRLLDQLLFSNLDSSRTILLQLESKKNQYSKAEKGELNAKWGIYYALSGNNTKALSSFWEAYSFTVKFSLERASMLKNLANVYKAMADYDQTDKMLKAALEIYRSKRKKLDELIVLGELASSAYYQMRWERAISLNLKVIRGLKKLDDKKFLAIQQQRLANIYYSLDKYDAAIKVYRESMLYYDSQPNELLNAGYIRIALGDSYFQSGDFKRAAILYLNAAEKLKNIDVSKFWLTKSKLAQTYLEQGIKAKGLLLLKEAYLNLKQLGLPNLDESLTYLLRNATRSSQNKVFLLNELSYVFKLKASGVPFNNISWSALLEEAS